MISPTSKLRARWTLGIVIAGCAMTLASGPRMVGAQGLVKGVEQGAREGNRAAGPVGGVLGGAIGGVVGVVTGVTSVITGTNGQPASAARETRGGAKASKSATGRASKGTKGAKGTKQAALLTQKAAPQLTSEQIVANSDANIERIKKELNLTSDQEKHWPQFASAMHYLGNNGAERLNLRIARAKRDPPDDIVEQMRNEAQFLVDRAADQRSVADAAEPLFASLDDTQKPIFIEEDGSAQPSARLRLSVAPGDHSRRGLQEAKLRKQGEEPTPRWFNRRPRPRIAGHACPGVGGKARYPAILPRRRGGSTHHTMLKKN